MRTWHQVTCGLLSLSWTVLRKKSQQFSQQVVERLLVLPCKPLKYKVEAYRCWCAAWTSNPVIGANPLDGGFDSHTLPPLYLPWVMIIHVHLQVLEVKVLTKLSRVQAYTRSWSATINYLLSQRRPNSSRLISMSRRTLRRVRILSALLP